MMLKMRRVAYSKNEYAWGVQWVRRGRFGKVFVFGRMKRVRVALWWNILYYRQEGTRLHALAKGMS